ncbi:MAG: hypothetical protein ACLQDL_09465 [Spirochaetia bacterium]
MGRSPYQSEKRRKELARLKKQEEKRQRRFNKGDADAPEGDRLAAIPTVQFGLDGLPIEQAPTEAEAGAAAEDPEPDSKKDQETSTPS